ncbi:MAG: GlxA family transcriptional regulator [Paracoccaceae bacterium]
MSHSVLLYFFIKDRYMSFMDNIGIEGQAQRVGILPLQGFALLSYASTAEPFRAANLHAQRPIYEVINLSIDGGPVKSSGAAAIQDVIKISSAPKLDMLFVVAGGDPVRFADRNVLRWIARMARTTPIIGGVSGGPVVLAKSGIMEGRRMTVHWEHAAALAEISPNLAIERSLYVIDRGRVTCAGGTAPMDLIHALISQQHGGTFARLVSDWFLHTEIRPSGGQQRGGLVARLGTTNRAIIDAVDVMESHVADPLTLTQLSQVAGVGSRQLNRLFKTELGKSTMLFYRQLRLDKARNLLQNSPLHLTEIALATGFANSSHFSRAYSDYFGTAPSTDRIQLARYHLLP